MPDIRYKDNNWERKIPRKDKPRDRAYGINLVDLQRKDRVMAERVYIRNVYGRFQAEVQAQVYAVQYRDEPMNIHYANPDAKAMAEKVVDPPPAPFDAQEWIRGVLKNNNNQRITGVNVMAPDSTLWKYGACCSQTLLAVGIGYRVEAIKGEYTMEDLGWTPDLFKDYLNFIKDCNPEFGPMIREASITHPAILLNHPNPNARYQAFCLLRLAWEWPKGAMMGVYLHKHTECTTGEIQILMTCFTGGGGGHYHVSGTGYKFLDKYTLGDIEERLKNPEIPDEGVSGCASLAFGMDVGWNSKGSNPLARTVVDALTKKYSKQGLFTEAMMIQEARRFFFKGIFGGDYGCAKQ